MNIFFFYVSGVGPIKYAYSTSSPQLFQFSEHVTALQAYGGGDRPEYAFYAMLQGLRARDNDSFELMIEGSQMIVLTDAPSKQPELVNNVINDAVARRVCIHIFATNDNALEDGHYRRITEETHGILHTHWSITSFARAYSEKQCRYLEDFRVKRAVLSSESSHCKRFVVSRLATLLKLSIQASYGATVTLSRPNRISSRIVIRSDGSALFTEKHPVSGEWRTCTSTGSIQIYDAVTYVMDITVVYLINESSSTTPPPACKFPYSTGMDS